MDGIPTEHLSLGTIAGREITVDTTDLAWLNELEETARLARARLSMWFTDHPAVA